MGQRGRTDGNFKGDSVIKERNEKNDKEILSTVMSVCIAVSVIASNTVTAANPNKINLDFTTAAGVSAAVSVTGTGTMEFDSAKGAAKFTAGKNFNAYFSNTE